MSTSTKSRLNMTRKDKIRAYTELMRFDKPVGIELLLWPTLWAVFLAAYAAGGLPSIKLVVIFTLGSSWSQYTERGSTMVGSSSSSVM